MPKEDQAQADLDPQVTQGEPPADAVESHDPEEHDGATGLEAYYAEVSNLLAGTAQGAETPATTPPEGEPAEEENPDQTPEEMPDEPAADDAEAPAEAEPDTSGEEQAQGDGEEDEGDDDAPEATGTPIKTKRYRLPVSNEVEAEALALKKRHPDWSLTQCEDKAKAILGKTETDGPEAAETSEPAESVESCRAKLDTLREQKAQAIEDVDFAVVAKLDKEIDELRDRIADLRVEEAHAAQAAQEKFHSEVENSKSLAVRVYPDTTNADSPLVAKMVEIDRQLAELDDPLYYSPNKPFKLAQMAAAELGIAPNSKRAPATAKSTAKPNGSAVSRPTVQPASGSARTTTPTTASRFDRELAEAAAGGIHDYEAFVARLTGKR